MVRKDQKAAKHFADKITLEKAEGRADVYNPQAPYVARKKHMVSWKLTKYQGRRFNASLLF